VFSTHDPRVMQLADRLVHIEDGRIIRLGLRTAGNKLLYAAERFQDTEHDGT
jgi:putative ABC transport system ATP-binding protein